MVDPYKNIPNVLPGSQAAQAVDEMNQFIRDHGDLSPSELEQAIKNKIMDYGGDPVTAAAAGRTASVMAEKDPARTSMIAENVVGTTLADPNLASSQAADRVDARLAEMGRDPSSLTDDEKSAIAYEEANVVLQNAGMTDTDSSQALQEAVDQYIADGATPSQAAAAAVVAVLAQAMSSASSFSIFGYFSMLVHENVNYIFKNTETMNVTGSALHTHLASTTYDMPERNFYIKATTIKTKSNSETVRTHPGRALGKYDGSYDSYAQRSGSLFAWSNQVGVNQHLVGGVSGSLAGVRVYVAFYDSDLTVWSSAVPAKRDCRATVLECYSMIMEKYSSKTSFLG